MSWTTVWKVGTDDRNRYILAGRGIKMKGKETEQDERQPAKNYSPQQRPKQVHLLERSKGDRSEINLVGTELEARTWKSATTRLGKRIAIAIPAASALSELQDRTKAAMQPRRRRYTGEYTRENDSQSRWGRDVGHLRCLSNWRACCGVV